jgi:hypothetical protein
MPNKSAKQTGMHHLVYARQGEIYSDTRGHSEYGSINDIYSVN